MVAVSAGHWPIFVASAILLVAATLQLTAQRVPNVFTLSAILGGWIVGGLIEAGAGIPSAGGGVVQAVGGTIVALLVSLPFYGKGLGAGCVKTQMAFGAWVGCAIGFGPAIALIAICSLLANLATMAAAKFWVRLKPNADLFPAQVTHSFGSIVGIVICVTLGVF